MLNLNGSLTKAGVKYDTLWSVDFSDDFFLKGLAAWLKGGPVPQDLTHIRPLSDFKLPKTAEAAGILLAQNLKREKAIMHGLEPAAGR